MSLPPEDRQGETPRSTVSAVIVNWNGGDTFSSCIQALHKQSRPFDEIIVVDNGSNDGSLERALARFPDIRAVRNDRNLGFGAGVNRGAAAATGEWLALINNDAILDPDWLVEMLRKAASAPDIGMVACKVYLDRKRRILDKIGHRIAVDGQNYGRGHRLVDDGQYDSLQTVAWPDGCAGLWRRSVFEQVGGMDEEFFAYADDADLGIRFRLAGWRTAFAPSAVAEHRHSQTLGAYSPQKLFLVERNRIWLAARHFPWTLQAVNPILWTWRGFLTLLYSRGNEGSWAQVPPGRRGAAFRAVVKAQIAGWAGAPRQWRKRAENDRRLGPGWRKRIRKILTEARVPLRELARGNVP